MVALAGLTRDRQRAVLDVTPGSRPPCFRGVAWTSRARIATHGSWRLFFLSFLFGKRVAKLQFPV
jgi:hypothetical protein